ncbi:MAG: translocation/assembly module TamB domain-containing protein [Methylotenera sp.]|nr:translocation/assembly module TamB domain-containing protein [Methylotenera sp.]
MTRYLQTLLVSIALLLLPSAHSESTISVSTSLDTFSYDLDSIHLKLEKLSARWQLSPFGEGDLRVEQLKAKRLIITLKESETEAKESPLPNSIKLPFPIAIEQSEISEVIIVNGDDRQTLYNVKLNFEGNAKTLNLNLSHASTPWGEASAHINMSASKPFTLKGDLSLKKTDADYPYDLKTELSGDLNTINIHSTSWLTLQDGKINLLKSNTNQAGAQIIIDAQLKLNKNYAMHVRSQLLELSPARLGNYPEALLNVDVNLEGVLKPSLNAALAITTHDSVWQQQAVSGSINAQLIDQSLEQLTFAVNIANNQMKGTGNINKENMHLAWQADFPDMSKLDQAYAGQVNANGTIDGAIDNPSATLKLLAQKLQLSKDLKIEHLTGEANITAGENGTIAANIEAQTIKYGSYAPISSTITLKGTQADHTITINAENEEHQLQSTLKGGVQLNQSSAKKQWLGLLQQLDFAGGTPVTLKAPAPLSADLDQISLKQALLTLKNGAINIEHLHVGNNILDSKGSLEKITLDDLPPNILQLPNTLSSNAVFSGKWSLETKDAINAHFSLWRDSGDITFKKSDGSLLPLGLSETQLVLNVINNELAAKVSLNGKNIGTLDAETATRLTKTEAGFSLHNNAPFKLTSNAQLNTLLWLPMPSSMMDADLDGKITLSANADGTIEHPNLSGNVNGEKISFSLPSEGIQLSNGTFQARFENDQLHIEQMIWQGGSGNLSANGWVKLNQGKPTINLAWTADQFTILSRADRLLTLSGAGKTILANNLLNMMGDFTVNKGLVELAQEDTPTLGDDVVILGQTAVKKETSLQILLNGLQIKLGNDFTLRGRGLDAKLAGALTLTGLTEYRPYTEGSINVEKGTFMAYGQILTIDRGILKFNGPMDNPGLNIRAMRNSKPVNAGVEITGSATMPVVKLVSDPNVPETDKLAWLVLGHGTDQAGKNDFAMLSLAAGALFSQGQSVPLQSQIARAAGLDEFSFAGGDAENASLTLGKRLSSQLYLSYAKSISSLQDVARLTFNITPRWVLRAEAGNESAVDVLYTFSFK